MVINGWKCKDCGTVFVSERGNCLCCGCSDAAPILLEGLGEILTWTIVRVPQEQHAKDAPFAIGLIRLKEGPRLTARLSSATEDWSLGQRVKAVDNDPLIGLVFADAGAS